MFSNHMRNLCRLFPLCYQQTVSLMSLLRGCQLWLLLSMWPCLALCWPSADEEGFGVDQDSDNPLMMLFIEINRLTDPTGRALSEPFLRLPSRRFVLLAKFIMLEMFLCRRQVWMWALFSWAAVKKWFAYIAPVLSWVEWHWRNQNLEDGLNLHFFNIVYTCTLNIVPVLKDIKSQLLRKSCFGTDRSGSRMLPFLGILIGLLMKPFLRAGLQGKVHVTSETVHLLTISGTKSLPNKSAV